MYAVDFPDGPLPGPHLAAIPPNPKGIGFPAGGFMNILIASVEWYLALAGLVSALAILAMWLEE